MTRKQMRRYAEKISLLEKRLRNPSLDKEEERKIKNTINKTISTIMAMPDGVENIFEIDIMVRDMMKGE